jgi:acetoin utilization deacetylase AcuC-like enzyme
MNTSRAAQLGVFYPEGHAAHALVGHPERPERVEAIRNALEEMGAWENAIKIHAQAPLPAVLNTVHNPAYLSLLERAARRGGGYLDSDTYVTAHSWDLALQAAGGALNLAQTIWNAEPGHRDLLWRGFALTRPPGHHATHGQGMGFCLLNNIAVAAEHLIQEVGARRLAIIDLDLHHGNGTQDIFWERSDVLFISTHQSPLYPGSGAVNETGAGAGQGWTVNLPLPPGSGDEAFETCMQTLILPVLARAQPEMLLVSYGFDTHWLDPLGSLQLSAGTYGRLVASLVHFADQHCQGRIALILEGGYNLEAAAVCSQAVCAALLGLSWDDPLGPSLDPVREQTRSAWRRLLDAALRIHGL